MKIIFIKQLETITTIGICDWEKIIKQKIFFNIKIAYYHDIKNNNYIDYANVAENIIQYVENKKFSLIEDIAEEVSSLILFKFTCIWVKVEVQKPSALMQASYVSVAIKRSKKK